MTEYLINYLYCHNCSKCVSTGYIPIPTDTPDRGLIVRAYIECPECIEKRGNLISNIPPKKDSSKGLKAFVKAKGGHAGTAAIVQQIREALLVTGGRQDRAAEILGLSQRSLSYYVRKYELKPNLRKERKGNEKSTIGSTAINSI